MHPYKNLRKYASWRHAIGETDIESVDPVVEAPFRIDASDPVMTAGSCFAQHISNYLQSHGFNYLVTERAHPLANAEDATLFNYGTFSARYGNVYTTRQLLQLFNRAYGEYVPQDNVWITGQVPGGQSRVLDPYRPRIQPDGFSSVEELRRDRERHFAAVRDAFTRCKYFVFTLGLTECWVNKRDGAVYPLCPGVDGGEFDPDHHEFRNFSVDEVVADFDRFMGRLESVNPGVRVILTVSPVPLVATAMDRHVLVSTTYSKSVLRVAAEVLCQRRANIGYFPSYEIVTGNYSRGRYFADDLRNVTAEGVKRVMTLFMRHYTSAPAALASQPVAANSSRGATQERQRDLGDVLKTVCEEEMLDSAAGPSAVRK